MFDWLLGTSLECPNCGFKFRYTVTTSDDKPGNYGLCPNCKRGMYCKNGVSWHFPIKPVNDWIIMPICQVCGKRPAVLYDGNDYKMKCSEDAYSFNANQPSRKDKE